MYLFYENFKDSSGTVLATDLIWSSFSSGVGIHWKNDRATHDFILNIAKMPKLSERSFDANTKVWSYIGDAGHNIIAMLKTMVANVNLKVDFIEVDDLKQQISNGGILPEHKKKAQFKSADNFYYQKTAPPAPKILSAGEIREKLGALLQCDDTTFIAPDAKEQLKKLYRRAALKYHPDRNNGDGSKMSELNMLWGMYNG